MNRVPRPESGNEKNIHKKMIYIEEKIYDRQVDLLEFFYQHGKYDIIIWFYPEAKKRSICGLKLTPKGLMEGEQVTIYGDGFKPKKTRRVNLTAELLEIIRNSAEDIQLNCDSLTLYSTEENNWTACIIPHERMGLVRDDEHLDSLTIEGLEPSLEKPEWW